MNYWCKQFSLTLKAYSNANPWSSCESQHFFKNIFSAWLHERIALETKRNFNNAKKRTWLPVAMEAHHRSWSIHRSCYQLRTQQDKLSASCLVARITWAKFVALFLFKRIFHFNTFVRKFLIRIQTRTSSSSLLYFSGCLNFGFGSGRRLMPPAVCKLPAMLCTKSFTALRVWMGIWKIYDVKGFMKYEEEKSLTLNKLSSNGERVGSSSWFERVPVVTLWCGICSILSAIAAGCNLIVEH